MKTRSRSNSSGWSARGWVVLLAGLIPLCVRAFTPVGRHHTTGQRRSVFPTYKADKRCHHDAVSRLLYKDYVDEPKAFFDERQRKESDFERRMREAALGKARSTRQAGMRGPKRRRPMNVKVVETLEDYKTNVAESDRIVVVRFFAPWCKACRAMAPYFYRLAETNPSLSFVEVPVSAKSAAIHQGLEVPSIPFGHIYHPTAGLVEEMKINRKVFSTFENKLRSYVIGLCELSGEGVCSSPYIDKQALDDDEDGV